MNKRRYFVALLWHWTLPFMFGVITAAVVLMWQLVGVFPEIEQAFEQAISAHCEVNDK
ncbi:hypothetical protein [Stutzerimonas nitrititolerans]|uniref:hypothetical protein n=1 Tax=Stutzerimonas nitrititolerans TaxID=2482751 RepID=UPI00289DDA35|nr:hypothetical protein [Stutzerimonas nitrititolerans]